MIKPRGVLIAGNWKMNCGPKDTVHFFSELRSQWSNLNKNDAWTANLKACIAPPFISLETAIAQSKEAPFPLTIAAQNAHWESQGAFTGEVSGPMLKELGINTVIIGHSERRQYFGETDTTVYKRAEGLLKQGFQVILCIGETLEERKNGKTDSVLIRQLEEIIPINSAGIKPFFDGRLILAYEPIWAIGTGLTASPEQAEEVHSKIRDLIRERIPNNQAAEITPILYGGSVTPANIDSLLNCVNVDGALVGGASLKPLSFIALIQSGARSMGSN